MSRTDPDKEVNRPIETLRDGALKVSIFRNSGERGDYYSMVPTRIYTDATTGEVREASSLGGSEPLRMAHLLGKGYERVNEYKQQDRQTRQQPQAQSQAPRRPINHSRNGYDRER